MTTISIVINNYNYGRFLARCIDSALQQKAPVAEVIVVDDGSTDNSRNILDAYAGRVKVIAKTNGGQASAINAGYAASRGDWIWFLDADDWLCPDAVVKVAPHCTESLSRIQGRLMVVNGDGAQFGFVPKGYEMGGCVEPDKLLREGSLLVAPPTSGNVFSRSFLKRVCPIPEKEFSICADTYLVHAAYRDQRVTRIPEVLGFYNAHGENAYLINSIFNLDRERIRKRLSVIASIRRLLINEYAEIASGQLEIPYNTAHLKSLVLAWRIGLDAESGFHFPVDSVKAQYRGRISHGRSRLFRLKEWLGYLIICCGPLWVIRIAGRMEPWLRSLQLKKGAEPV